MSLRQLALLLCVAIPVGLAGPVWSTELREFANAEQKHRYQALLKELRCLVCQNQSLADSDAELAQDLRREVYEMLGKGEADKAILQFMVERYGDFVLYRPPFKATTAVLWLGPFVLCAGGLGFLALHLRRRKAAADSADTLDEAEQARLDALLQRPSGDQTHRSVSN